MAIDYVRQLRKQVVERRMEVDKSKLGKVSAFGRSTSGQSKPTSTSHHQSSRFLELNSTTNQFKIQDVPIY